MSVPPATWGQVSGSARISAAAPTVTTGSKVLSKAARAGPRRASPAKKPATGTTVQPTAMATIQSQPQLVGAISWSVARALLP